MRLRKIGSTLLLVSMFALPLLAQYKEMSKLDSLSKVMPEAQMFSGMAAHFSVAAETLKQEKSANNLSFGQLYLVHAVAKISKSDVKNILLESQNKPWPTIIQEKNVDMKQLGGDEATLEKALQNLSKSK